MTPNQQMIFSRCQKIIRSIIEHRLEADQIEMNEEMREATANVIASTLAQEYDQVSEKS